MTALATRVMLWLINRLCDQHVMRPQLWAATPGPQMQMCLEIIDKRTNIPFGRVYLQPHLMREFFELGIKGVDEYVTECRKVRGDK